MKKLFPLFLTLLSLTALACTPTYVNKTQGAPAQQRLTRGLPAYIALPQDGNYAGKAYAGSGARIAGALTTALARYCSQVTTGGKVESEAQMLSSAMRANAKYAFHMTLAHWEPRAVVWSGKPTQVSIIVSVHDVPTGRKLFSRQVGAHGKSVTVISDHADDLAEEALKRFADSIF